jgi:hypothetical protein
MAEFVNGYEWDALVRAFLFWFSTNKARRSYYLLAEKIAYKISKAGYRLLPAAALALWKRVTKSASGRWNFSGIEYCIAV